MSAFRKKIGERIELEVGRDGYLNHDYGHGARLSIRQGWNESCEWSHSNLSVDDLKDLHYVIGRAIEQTPKDS